MSEAGKITDVVHELVDIAAGIIPRLTHERAAQLHETVTPGYNDKPLTAEEQAQLAALQERQARESQHAADAPAADSQASAPEPRQSAPAAWPRPAGPDAGER